MLKFILLKVIFLLVLVSFVVVFLGKTYPVDLDHYFGAILDKHKFIQTVKSPKIIITGGSNACWSLNSQLIIDRTGFPVANMALHSGLGYSYMALESLPYIHRGDVVLMIPEYWIYFYSQETTYKELYRALNYHPEALWGLDWYTRIRVAANYYLEKAQKGAFLLLSGKKKETTENDLLWSRRAFDKNGDVVAHLGLENEVNLVGEKIIQYKKNELGENFVQKTKMLRDYCNKKGAKLFFSFPSISEGTYDSATAYTAFKLLKEIPRIGILGEPKDFVYSDSLFYNTNYHLNIEGREKRTRILIDKLVEARLSVNK